MKSFILSQLDDDQFFQNKDALAMSYLLETVKRCLSLNKPFKTLKECQSYTSNALRILSQADTVAADALKLDVSLHIEDYLELVLLMKLKADGVISSDVFYCHIQTNVWKNYSVDFKHNQYLWLLPIYSAYYTELETAA